MKVALHVGQLHGRAPGGIGTYVRHLVRGLAGSRGIDLVTFGAGVRPEDVPGYVALPRPWGPLRAAAWTFVGHPHVDIPCDVLHAPSLAIPPTESPLVVTIHDVAFLHHPQAFTRWGRRFHRRALANARARAAIVITPSAYVAHELDGMGFSGRTVAIPHGIEMPSGERDGALPHGVRAPYVLWAGTVEPRKDLDTLVRAFGVLPERDLQLVLAGPAGWGHGLPERASADERVVLTGPVEPPVLHVLYRHAAVFAFPSLDEGFGFPPLEAMARGCPVVVANAGALPEVVGDAAVLVPPADADALAGALERLVTDGAEAERLRRAGRHRAAGFTWDRSIRAHVEAYGKARV